MIMDRKGRCDRLVAGANLGETRLPFALVGEGEADTMALRRNLLREPISRRQLLRMGAGLASGALAGSGAASLAHSGEGRQASTRGYARVIRHVNTSERKVCLSFDDMWSEVYALRIGRAFHEQEMPLTLFPAGLAVRNNNRRPLAGHENLYARLRDMGHEFGCHLHTHRDIRDFSLQQLIDEELEPSLAVLRQALGPRFMPVGIRPPYGVVTEALLELSARYGIPLILWGLDSQDSICTWRCQGRCPQESSASEKIYESIWHQDLEDELCAKSRCVERCVDSILDSYNSYMRPGTIILHHVLEASYLAIRRIVAFMSDWNLRPVTLSELLRHASV